MKVPGTSLYLLTDRDHLDMAENWMRGGMSSVYSSRLFVANKRYVSKYNELLPTSIVLMVDVKNLYGGFTHNFPLPQCDFQSLNDDNQQDILATSEDSSVDYIMEIDFKNGENLHKLHGYFSLLSTRKVVKVENHAKKYCVHSTNKNKKTAANFIW